MGKISKLKMSKKTFLVNLWGRLEPHLWEMGKVLYKDTCGKWGVLNFKYCKLNYALFNMVKYVYFARTENCVNTGQGQWQVQTMSGN